jgi:hypothetical protein
LDDYLHLLTFLSSKSPIVFDLPILAMAASFEELATQLMHLVTPDVARFNDNEKLANSYHRKIERLYARNGVMKFILGTSHSQLTATIRD